MARYSFTVSYNDPNIGFQIQDAVAKILAEEEASQSAATPQPEQAPPPKPSVPQPIANPVPAPAPVRTIAPIPQPVPHHQPPPQFPSSQNRPQATPTIRDPNSPITENQISFINRLASERGISDAFLFQQINQLLQTPPDEQIVQIQQLFKGEASTVIEALKNGQIVGDAPPF